MENDLVRRMDVYEMLNGIGGCDASEEYFKGWDKAIDGAISELEKVPSAGSDLIHRCDVLDALVGVFKKFNISFDPKTKHRRTFSKAVTEAIWSIPAEKDHQPESYFQWTEVPESHYGTGSYRNRGPCGIARNEFDTEAYVGLSGIMNICRSDSRNCEKCPANPYRDTETLTETSEGKSSIRRES